ncbi:hydroxyacid dehydrogenase, partial [Piscirickettsiaceae bacterium NZ-RLO2]
GFFLEDKNTHHLINTMTIEKMKPGVILINTSRGAIIDSQAAIAALKNKMLGGLALDVYEQEEHLFFSDHSNEIIDDDILQRLLTFPNVIITGHQGFLTHEAMINIAETTLKNAEQLLHNCCENTLT